AYFSRLQTGYGWLGRSAPGPCGTDAADAACIRRSLDLRATKPAPPAAISTSATPPRTSSGTGSESALPGLPALIASLIGPGLAEFPSPHPPARGPPPPGPPPPPPPVPPPPVPVPVPVPPVPLLVPPPPGV